MQTDRTTEQEERLTAFIESMKVRQTPFLMELERKALKERIPIIRPQTRALIQFLLEVRHPRQILEVGTAIGYSTLVLREYAPEDARIITIEKDPEREAQARFHVREYEAGRGQAAAAPLAGKREQQTQQEVVIGPVTLILGDAGEVLEALAKPGCAEFDFIFMDAAKGQYIHYLPAVKRLLAPGGILLSDNILKGGEVLESRYAVTRRNRTIHRRMREYLEALTNDPELSTVVLSTGDGAAMSVRIQGQNCCGK